MTFLVQNDKDSGAGSLRQAIINSNLATSSGTNSITFDIPTGQSLTIALKSELPAITQAVVIDGTTQPGIGATPAITIDGSKAGVGVSGLDIEASGVTVKGLVIDSCSDSGILLSGSTGDLIIDDYLGVTASGDTDAGNGRDGIHLTGGADDNVISDDVLSGNADFGVEIDLGSNDNTVEGSMIGTNAAGSAGLGNSMSGVYIEDSSDGNVIGGTTSSSANVISKNADYGIEIATSSSQNVVEGNLIGTDITGTQKLGNSDSGVWLTGDSSSNTIGGTVSGTLNVISSNGDEGVKIDSGSSQNVVVGDFIGTDITGKLKLGNVASGVLISDSSNNTVGGAATGVVSVISSNGGDGVHITNSATQNLVEGNLIGTDVTGKSKLGNADAGLLIDEVSSANTVGGTTAAAGNVISANGEYGVQLDTGSSHNLIDGNRIGTDIVGTGKLGNVDSGVYINDGSFANTIGGTVSGARNILSANGDRGVHIDNFSYQNLIEGNFIGTDVSGTLKLGNVDSGVLITGGSYANTVGGTVSGAVNVISNNGDDGVDITGGSANNVVAGDLIGTDVTGEKKLGNVEAGVLIDSASFDNTVGGTTAAAANVISANGEYGVEIDNGSSGNVVAGNLVGTDMTGTEKLGNVDSGVYIDGGSFANTVGGTISGARNILSANGGRGVHIDNGSYQNLVEGNFIGTDITGTQKMGNVDSGVLITNGSDFNTVGGTIVGARNVISSNGNRGVNIGGGSNHNVIEGDYIGTDLTGKFPMGNTDSGVLISGGSADNTIGGTSAGSQNVISANGYRGVHITEDSAHNLIEGNLIGTDYTGTQNLGNVDSGILIDFGSYDNTIGGTITAARNVIAASGDYGIHIDSGSDRNLLEGNYIGTDISGKLALGNNGSGVYINQSNLNTVGGTTAGAMNVISGNDVNGVHIDGGSMVNVIEGNKIGTIAGGTAALPNKGDGVLVTGGSGDNVIGGSSTAAGNLIAYNGANGISLDGAGENNSIEADTIDSNTTNGVYISDTLSTFVTDCTIELNGGWGILVKKGSTHTFSGNTVTNNKSGNISG